MTTDAKRCHDGRCRVRSSTRPARLTLWPDHGWGQVKSVTKLIPAISNPGRLWFMVFCHRFNADVFIRFLGRLLKATAARKNIIVIDSRPAHKAAKVARWIDAKRERRAKLELCFMPGYSPELYPDEMLDQHTKQAMRWQRPRDQSQMMANARSHLRRRQK